MKVAILAGGLGSRLQEETTTRPKPMVEIGGKPILWHILNLYAQARSTSVRASPSRSARSSRRSRRWSADPGA